MNLGKLFKKWVIVNHSKTEIEVLLCSIKAISRHNCPIPWVIQNGVSTPVVMHTGHIYYAHCNIANADISGRITELLSVVRILLTPLQ